MLRIGAPPPGTREMDVDDIFFARVRLLVIMAQAFLSGCAMGEYRRQAILENACHVEAESIDLAGGGQPAGSIERTQKGNLSLDHIFFQRIKLLAVMMKAVAKGFPMGEKRKTALLENVDIIARSMSYDSRHTPLTFLKVA